MPLTERQETERGYYDTFYADLDRATPEGHLLVDPARPPIYFAGMERIVARAIAGLGPLEGKRILVVGCGTGRAAVWLALHGAAVWALDISEAAVQMTRRAAALNGVGTAIETLCMPAEAIGRVFHEGAFDLAYGTEVLHHLDLEQFGPALASVMVSGGRAAFIEPMALHPFLQWLRGSAPVRGILPVFRHTPTETILTRCSLEALAGSFSVVHEDFGAIIFLIGLATRYRRLGALIYRAAGVGDGRAPFAFDALASRLFDLDSRVVESWPFIRAFCRKTVIMLEKGPQGGSGNGCGG